MNVGHYVSGGMECIDAMMAVYGRESVIDFMELSMFKYLWRARKKGFYKEDMLKVKDYAERLVELYGADGDCEDKQDSAGIKEPGIAGLF